MRRRRTPGGLRRQPRDSEHFLRHIDLELLAIEICHLVEQPRGAPTRRLRLGELPGDPERHIPDRESRANPGKRPRPNLGERKIGRSTPCDLRSLLLRAQLVPWRSRVGRARRCVHATTGTMMLNIFVTQSGCFMRLQELGYVIRKARLAKGLTQEDIGSMAKLSRVTINQLENGVFPDIGVRKAQAILELVGLTLQIQPAACRGRSSLERITNHIDRLPLLRERRPRRVRPRTSRRLSSRPGAGPRRSRSGSRPRPGRGRRS